MEVGAGHLCVVVGNIWNEFVARFGVGVWLEGGSAARTKHTSERLLDLPFTECREFARQQKQRNAR